MAARPLENYSRLCIHTITNKPWTLEQCIENYSRSGIGGVTVWRDALADRVIRKAGEEIRAAGLEIVSLCRGGFFPSREKAKREKAVEENRTMVDEAAELGAPLIVLVCGAEPGLPLEEARDQIRDGIARVLPHAESRGVRLAVEPLHPMYADSRSAINTLAQANDLCDRLASPMLGVAVDVYHLWWDPALRSQLERAGKAGRLFAFHISDWRTPTEDLLLDRGLMGEGCIPIREIRGWVEETGFRGYNEVEIFSTRLWQSDQHAFLESIKSAYLQHS